MENKRLVEICQMFAITHGHKVTQYCQSLIRELGLSPDEIEKTEIEYGTYEEDAEIRLLRCKIVKAVATKLRAHLYSAAFTKGIVEIGKPLPVVGFWKDERILLEIGTTGMFIIKKSEDGSIKGTTHRDPLKNPGFIAMLV